MKKQLILGFIGACIATTTLLAKDDEPNKRLRNSTMAFRELMDAPDKGIPEELFDKAKCVIIVPNLFKGAFVVGGKYGRGFASCRQGVHGWSSPAAVAIEGGSFGLQLGGSSTDVIMLVMNESGMKKLLSDKFTIGGEAAAAAGPVGRHTSANTDAMLRAEILSWSRARGVFAGISLEGATLRRDEKENQALYGREISNHEILENGVPVPPAARELVAVLNRHSVVPREKVAVDIEPLKNPGGRVVLNETVVHFATNEWTVPRESDPSLSVIATELKNNPDWKIRIEGHTDNVGGKASNQKLSQQRANAVMDWLVDHGVERRQLSARGYGETKPAGDNSTDGGKASNRRVELVRQ